ncbi:hypothetical protein COB72_07840 [bacterium]|nr:MAG: hypothetical protein COB72_07840 [bacterium]
MFTPRIGTLVGLLCLSSGTATVIAEVPTAWTFELQCRSSLDAGTPTFNLPFPSLLSSQYVSIGEAGDIAIRVVLSGSEGVFYGQDGVGAMIFTAPAPVDPIWSTTLDLRNGFIAIEMGNFGDGAQLWDTSGALVNNFSIGGSEGVSGFNGVTVTSDGKICYRGDSGSNDKIVIDQFVGGVRTQTLIAQTGTGDYTFLFSPEINDAGQILTNTIPGGSTRRIVLFDAAGAPTTVAQTGAVWNAFVNSTALAQNGDVAFDARRTSGSIWEVIHWDGTDYTTIADGNHPNLRNGAIGNFPPVVNSNGWVAFRAGDVEHSATGLWVGDGTDLVQLIEFDQMIETDLGMLPLGFDFGGITGKQVLSGVVDINENGQVAFSAFLQNGTIGVFVATPVMNNCVADFNGDGMLNFFDVSAFLTEFGAQSVSADLNEDGSWNFFDVSAFLQAFNMGCP